MSAERPDALELLEVARETLLQRVLPELEGDARYQALMIANAMAIAIRELTPGAVELEAELERLRGLYEGEGQSGLSGPGALEFLEEQLAKDLRAGELDGGPQLGVRRLLRARTEARVRVSNPKRLDRERGKG